VLGSNDRLSAAGNEQAGARPLNRMPRQYPNRLTVAKGILDGKIKKASGFSGFRPPVFGCFRGCLQRDHREIRSATILR
jgi:hypothetical protein